MLYNWFTISLELLYQCCIKWDCHMINQCYRNIEPAPLNNLMNIWFKIRTKRSRYWVEYQENAIQYLSSISCFSSNRHCCSSSIPFKWTCKFWAACDVWLFWPSVWCRLWRIFFFSSSSSDKFFYKKYMWMTWRQCKWSTVK